MQMQYNSILSISRRVREIEKKLVDMFVCLYAHTKPIACLQAPNFKSIHNCCTPRDSIEWQWKWLLEWVNHSWCTFSIALPLNRRTMLAIADEASPVYEHGSVPVTYDIDDGDGWWWWLWHGWRCAFNLVVRLHWANRPVCIRLIIFMLTRAQCIFIYTHVHCRPSLLSSAQCDYA